MKASFSRETTTEKPTVRKPLSWLDFFRARQLAQPPASPAQIVFFTWELCENIFKHLSCDDLARARGICTMSNTVTKHSPSLQQAQYLEPRTHNSDWVITGPNRLPGCAQSDSTNPVVVSLYRNRHTGWNERVTFELHPALKGDGMRFNYKYKCWTMRGNPRWLWQPRVEFKDIGRIAATSIHSNLNDMLVCQPPARVIRIFINDNVKQKRSSGQPPLPDWCVREDRVETILVQDEKGIRFGQLFEAIGMAIRRHKNASVGRMIFV